MLRAAIGFTLAVAVLTFIGGCAPYVAGFEYSPRPAMVEVPPAATQPATTQPTGPAVALASVIGVRRADQQLPLSVEIRLQLENNSAGTLAFDPRSLSMTDGEFLPFPAPAVNPPQALSLAPGQTAIVSIYFPFPPARGYDNVDMQSLQLRWSMAVDGHSVSPAVYFRRLTRVYYYEDPYPYPVGFYGGGVFIVHRH